MIDVVGNRHGLSGFFISGMLLSFLGAILPAWRHHIDTGFSLIGYYFLALNLGILIAVRCSYALLPRKGVGFVLGIGSLLACIAFLCLAVVSSPALIVWRYPGLILLGGSAGFLNSAVFHAISPLYKQDPASTVNLGGILFGLGCVAMALLVAGTFFVYTVPSILILLATIPGLFAISYARGKFAPPEAMVDRPLREVLKDFRNPAAVMFSLLLFFQFGNEWALAGWLPIFLIRRLGISPETSLTMLALYWAALLVGRILAQVVLGRVGHTRLLSSSALAAVFGCTILSLTAGSFGACVGIVLVGFGFASIYPIVAEKIGHRFTYYHPGFYNGIFSLAVTGGLLAPWTIGYFAEAWGIQAIMVVPLLGTVMVVLLVVLITLETKFSGNLRRRAGAV
ncbi:MAG TPA: MFS transporter [Bryobacteraceae bacterium]|nr:MFS transporter [Bryobacteraceae bacterium]